MIPTRLHESSELKNSPVPPGHHERLAGHHWLTMVDFDKRHGDLIVLQWNPGAKKWSQSGCVGTGWYIDTSDFIYHSACPMPEEPNLTEIK